MNCMSFGKPPTLWWLLIVWAVSVPDSMTSVYSVPCARNLASLIFLASSLKTCTNSLPMIFRFFSGSVTPASLDMKRSLASTLTMFTPSPSLRAAMTSSLSFFLSRPWSTKIAVNWLPIALWSRVAVTLESTPPEIPKMTLASPTSSLIESTDSLMKSSMVQLSLAPQTSKAKRRRMSRPYSELRTSAWNWMA